MSNFYKELSSSEIKELIESPSFRLSTNVELPLYKGISSPFELYNYYYASPSKNIRESKTVTENGNAYNLLFNNLSNWRSFPKRESSIITSSNLSTANSFARTSINQKLNFGETYRVIPKYDSNIAISSKEDIWYSFQKALGDFSLRGLNISLVQFNLCIKELLDSVNDSNIKTFKWGYFLKYVEEISQEKLLPQKKISFESENVLRSLKKNKENILSFFETAFDPFRNGLELRQYNKTLNRYNYSNNEIWTESDSLLIKESCYLKLIV